MWAARARVLIARSHPARSAPALSPSRALRRACSLVSFDAAEQLAVVAHGGADVAVSTSLVRTLDYPLGAAVMVIGEIAEPRAASLVLRARVFASVEGIDYGTYFAAYRVAEQRLAATAGSGAEAGVE